MFTARLESGQSDQWPDQGAHFQAKYVRQPADSFQDFYGFIIPISTTVEDDVHVYCTKCADQDNLEDQCEHQALLLDLQDHSKEHVQENTSRKQGWQELSIRSSQNKAYSLPRGTSFDVNGRFHLTINKFKMTVKEVPSIFQWQ